AWICWILPGEGVGRAEPTFVEGRSAFQLVADRLELFGHAFLPGIASPLRRCPGARGLRLRWRRRRTGWRCRRRLRIWRRRLRRNRFGALDQRATLATQNRDPCGDGGGEHDQ